MKKSLTLLAFLLTFAFANSEKPNHTSKSTHFQQLSEEQNVVREIRETRTFLAGDRRLITQRFKSRNFRTLRENRQERLVQNNTRNSREIRYVKHLKRKYLAQVKNRN